MALPLLLRCGRVAAFKTFHRQAQGLQNLPAVSLCTKSGDSKKGSTKNEGDTLSSNKPDAAIKLTNEDLRKFLPRKTLVAFPEKAKLPSLERESVFSSTEGLGKKVTDRESSSSSSSESDSSSDSEEEDSGFKYTIKTKVFFPRRDPVVFEDRAKLQATKETQFSQEEIMEETPGKLPHSPAASGSPVQPQEMCQTAADGKLLRSDLSKSSVTRRPKEAHLNRTDLGVKTAKGQSPAKTTSKPTEAVSLPESSSSVLSSTRSVPENVAENLALLGQKTGMAKEPQRTELQRSPAGEMLQEEKWDSRMPVAESTDNVELIPEAGVEIEQESTIQEAKPPAEMAPEPFDISSYKNLQHHEYTPFTFVDYDVQLSKFRLPQPSSGRLSPRH